MEEFAFFKKFESSFEGLSHLESFQSQDIFSSITGH